MLAPERSPEDREAMALWLLAGGTAEILRDPSDRERRERLLNNAYSALLVYDPEGGLAMPLLHRTSQDAFESAFAACWPSLGRTEAVEGLVARMRAVAHPADGGEPVPDTQAAAFFEMVRDGAVRR